MMTRGQLAVIVDKNTVFTSIEFNGDMYLDGVGEDVLAALDAVYDLDDYKKCVEEINEDFYSYDDEELICNLTSHYSIEELMDMTSGYYDKWFSDYIYIKNLTDEDVRWTDESGRKHSIRPYETIAINFGGHTGVNADNVKRYNELSRELEPEDLYQLIMNNKLHKEFSIYRDTYELGVEVARSYINAPESFFDDAYINFEKIGEDEVNGNLDVYMLLDSGKVLLFQ